MDVTGRDAKNGTPRRSVASKWCERRTARGLLRREVDATSTSCAAANAPARHTANHEFGATPSPQQAQLATSSQRAQRTAIAESVYSWHTISQAGTVAQAGSGGIAKAGTVAKTGTQACGLTSSVGQCMSNETEIDLEVTTPCSTRSRSACSNYCTQPGQGSRAFVDRGGSSTHPSGRASVLGKPVRRRSRPNTRLDGTASTRRRQGAVGLL